MPDAFQLLNELRIEGYTGPLTLHCKDGVPVRYERMHELETATVSPAGRISQYQSPETSRPESPVPQGAGNCAKRLPS